MPRTKAVVRNLPPDQDASSFFASVDASGFDGTTCAYRDFVQGKRKTRVVIPSVAHVGFDTERALFDFAAAFDARAYDDAFGGEWRARVEYAPYQKIPRLKPRLDKREGTIERDAD